MARGFLARTTMNNGYDSCLPVTAVAALHVLNGRIAQTADLGTQQIGDALVILLRRQQDPLGVEPR